MSNFWGAYQYVVLISVNTHAYKHDLTKTHPLNLDYCKVAVITKYETKDNKKAPTPVKERELVLVCVASYP